VRFFLENEQIKGNLNSYEGKNWRFLAVLKSAE